MHPSIASALSPIRAAIRTDFCQYLDIRCERLTDHPLFNFNRLEALYRTEEYSFDPVLLREYYTARVEHSAGISVFKNTTVQTVSDDGKNWVLETVTNRRTCPACAPHHPHRHQRHLCCYQRHQPAFRGGRPGTDP